MKILLSELMFQLPEKEIVDPVRSNRAFLQGISIPEELTVHRMPLIHQVVIHLD